MPTEPLRKTYKGFEQRLELRSEYKQQKSIQQQATVQDLSLAVYCYGPGYEKTSYFGSKLFSFLILFNKTAFKAKRRA